MDARRGLILLLLYLTSGYADAGWRAHLQRVVDHCKLSFSATPPQNEPTPPKSFAPPLEEEAILLQKMLQPDAHHASALPTIRQKIFLQRHEIWATYALFLDGQNFPEMAQLVRVQAREALATEPFVQRLASFQGKKLLKQELPKLSRGISELPYVTGVDFSHGIIARIDVDPGHKLPPFNHTAEKDAHYRMWLDDLLERLVPFHPNMLIFTTRNLSPLFPTQVSSDLKLLALSKVLHGEAKYLRWCSGKFYKQYSKLFATDWWPESAHLDLLPDEVLVEVAQEFQFIKNSKIPQLLQEEMKLRGM